MFVGLVQMRKIPQEVIWILFSKIDRLEVNFPKFHIINSNDFLTLKLSDFTEEALLIFFI